MLGRHEGLEIMPCAPRNRAQHMDVGRRYAQTVLGFGRAADKEGEGRRADPEQREEEGDESAGGIGHNGIARPTTPTITAPYIMP